MSTKKKLLAIIMGLILQNLSQMKKHPYKLKLGGGYLTVKIMFFV